eukprot:CAMPEP_0172641624 /NCGR_PEP_ID=MMETSP1068-20121228/228251_1 /TAXON_ID=35684 /ORGANISM="Pseudopedinella elastica, Strain CCMP716" /LENGTH=174 /DNA_ID=CAMNT_0013455257 /DNA_START=109 /DNA_END=630 /DNA_ORIENTATION=-
MAAKRIGKFAQTKPFAFSIVIGTLNPWCADILTQTVVEKRGQIDWERNAVFAAFGAIYLGGFQYFLQVNLYRRMFSGMDRFAALSLSEKLRDGPGKLGAAKQIAFDVFVHLPLIYFPTFYCMKESIQGEAKREPFEVIQNGLSKYRQNFSEDGKAMLQVWVPGDIICFGMVPIW